MKTLCQTSACAVKPDFIFETGFIQKRCTLALAMHFDNLLSVVDLLT